MTDDRDDTPAPVDVADIDAGVPAPMTRPDEAPGSRGSAPPAALAWAIMGVMGLGGAAALVAAMGGILDIGTGALDGGAGDGVTLIVGGLLVLGGVGQIVGVVLGILLLAIWTGMAVSTYRRATGDSIGHSPLMAGFGYFICFLNLFVPYQVITRLWARTTEYDAEDPMAATPLWVQAWWPMWLIANVLGRAATKVSETDIGVLDVASAATFALTAAMTVFLVRSLQARLEAVVQAS